MSEELDIQQFSFLHHSLAGRACVVLFPHLHCVLAGSVPPTNERRKYCWTQKFVEVSVGAQLAPRWHGRGGLLVLAAGSRTEIKGGGGTYTIPGHANSYPPLPIRFTLICGFISAMIQAPPKSPTHELRRLWGEYLSHSNYPLCEKSMFTFSVTLCFSRTAALWTCEIMLLQVTGVNWKNTVTVN